MYIYAALVIDSFVSNCFRLIVEELAKLHSTDVSAVCAALGNGLHFDTRPSLFRCLHGWLNHIPDAYTDQLKQAKY